eukprot:622472-Rhodomonas_salina.1
MARRGVCQSTAEFLSRQSILFGAGLAALAACSAKGAQLQVGSQGHWGWLLAWQLEAGRCGTSTVHTR